MRLNKYTKFIVLVLLSYSFVACTCDCEQKTKAVKEDIDQRTRGESTVKIKALLESSLLTIDRFQFDNSQVEELEILSPNEDISIGGDAIFLKNILNALLGAEKLDETLAVELLMSDEPIEDGVFVFAIKSEEDKALNFQIYDEEGFNLVANNELNITTGSNYKALNLNSLQDGSYILKLKDTDDKELIRRIEIAN